MAEDDLLSVDARKSCRLDVGQRIEDAECIGGTPDDAGVGLGGRDEESEPRGVRQLVNPRQERPPQPLERCRRPGKVARELDGQLEQGKGVAGGRC